MTNALEIKLRKVEAEKAGSYDKRTEHLDAQGKGLFINRLILEDSPYLLQHAHNPVNWYPWGSEAFETAAVEDKPVFLSIGYSTCHWCHVMEVESFDNVEVAAVLNQDFISIKMDREQYPDIDEIYMTAVQLMSGHGGWPMSNFLLADGKPFFGATYFPAAAFIALLQKITAAWRQKPDELRARATQISEAIDRILSDRKEAASLGPELLDDMLAGLLQKEDPTFGGLAGAPKFPQEPLLLLMLDHVRRSRDLSVFGFVERALTGMARGGIYDQVAGGFHRYSVDAQWLVPHFEKMLYNQSQLGLVYLQAYQLSGNHFFRRVCEQTLDYVLRDMQLPEGGFYSATDADSEGEEGTFFTWTVEELKQVLAAAEARFVIDLYGVTEAGNFEGSNILNLSKTQPALEKDCELSGSSEDKFDSHLDGILKKLYLARERRVHPLRDDKLIVAWTGAMITTLATAAPVLHRPDWLQAAQRAARLVWLRNVDAAGRLHRIYLNNAVSIAGQLEDYANFCQALITLFDVTDDRKYLRQAAQLMDMTLTEFWDEQNGGFYLSPEQHKAPQLTRSRNASDGATVSAVATAVECLLMLEQRSELLARSSGHSYRGKIDKCIATLIAHINDNPMSHPGMLRAIALYEQGSAEGIQTIDGGRARIAVSKIESSADNVKIIEIKLSLESGWHIAAAGASGGEIAAIELDLAETETHWRIIRCDYPPANAALLNVDAGNIPIYEAGFTIKMELARTEFPADSLSATAALVLKLQCCNQESCLLPQTLRFRI
ncbi:MAG: thioredoxin domain-containing protein [Proteobacteria bacterium]|nr:thioredoxin domain-containing protein [Pseudomonadota bacterium]